MSGSSWLLQGNQLHQTRSRSLTFIFRLGVINDLMDGSQHGAGDRLSPADSTQGRGTHDEPVKIFSTSASDLLVSDLQRATEGAS